MNKLCLIHNEVCIGSGWQQPKKFNAVDILLRIKQPVTISRCNKCQEKYLEQEQFLKGGEA